MLPRVFLPRAMVELAARRVVRPLLSAPLPVSRQAIDALARAVPLPRGVERRAFAAGVSSSPGTPPAGAEGPPRVIYLHGGAYRIGSHVSHRPIASWLARFAQVPVLALDYRLAPEHPAPAALDDVGAAYAELAAEGRAPLLAGDSAGGGLALACAVAARDAGEPVPPGIALVSPWVDLTMAGESIRTEDDAMLTRAAMERGVRDYARELGADDPRCSPLRAELAGLPPVLIHAAAAELLRSEAEELAEHLRAADVSVELRIWQGLWHDFPTLAGMLREGREAVEQIGAWVRERLAAR
jgi:epsilon-lactone hydrolase